MHEQQTTKILKVITILIIKTVRSKYVLPSFNMDDRRDTVTVLVIFSASTISNIDPVNKTHVSKKLSSTGKKVCDHCIQP